MYKMLSITFLLIFSSYTEHLYQIYKAFVLDIQESYESIYYTCIYVFLLFNLFFYIVWKHNLHTCINVKYSVYIYIYIYSHIYQKTYTKCIKYLN